MTYRVMFSDRAKKELKKLNKNTSKFILSWISKNLEGCENPRSQGKALVANRSGQWRYRIGDYRLICQINDNLLIILALEIGHRKDIYR